MNVDTIDCAPRHVQRPIERHDAAERGDAVGVARPLVRGRRGLSDRDAAGIRVLDDGRRRLGELEDDARGRVEVEEVRVRELLALQDRRGAKPPIRADFPDGGRDVPSAQAAR